MGFQVPRVTIKIDFKEGASFGELGLISFGYGLHQAWIYSSMFDKGGIFGTGGLQAGPFNDQLSLAYFVSILIYGLLLLIASILDTKLIRALHATPTLVAAALLSATGTLLLLGSGAESPLDGSTLQIISGILTGTGSSILLLAWGIAFSRRDSASIIINGALSIAIGFGIYGLVLHQIPFPWGGVASALYSLCGNRPSACAASPREPRFRQSPALFPAAAHQSRAFRDALRIAGVLPRRGPGHHAPNLH